MNIDELNSILQSLESKERDCIAFSKKYESRKMEDLRQYYEGAGWAFKFAIHLLKEIKEK